PPVADEVEAPAPPTTVVGPADAGHPDNEATEEPAAEAPGESYNLGSSIPGIIGRAVGIPPSPTTPATQTPAVPAPSGTPPATPADNALFDETTPSEPAADTTEETEEPVDDILAP